MSTFSVIDYGFAVSGMVAEAFGLIACLTKRAYRWLPGLTAYLGILLVSDAICVACLLLRPSLYWSFYAPITIMGYVVETFAMLDLARARACRLSQEGRSITYFSMLVGGTCFAVVAVMLTGAAVYKGFDHDAQAVLHTGLYFAILRALILIMVLSLGKVFYTGTRDLVDEVTIAFAVIAFVELIAAVAHEYAGRHVYNSLAFLAIERLSGALWWAMIIFISTRVMASSRSSIVAAFESN